MKMQKIFQEQGDYWKKANQDFFGITAKAWDEMTQEEVQDSLFEDSENFWNTDNPCEVMSLILDGTICHDVDKMVPNSIMITQNAISECVDVRGIFEIKNKLEVKLIMSLPLPGDMITWTINKTKYTPRITAYRDYSQVCRKDKDTVVLGKDWTFDVNTNKFDLKLLKGKKMVVDTYDPYDYLSPRSIALLEAITEKKLNRNNFRKALRALPEFPTNSIYNYGFTHLNIFFNLLRYGKRFASPTKNVPLPVSMLFLKQNDDFYDVTNKMVIAKSPIFALENFRTIIYKSTAYNFSFGFEDTSCFLDAFKTTTNKAAGRHRLLLDNIVVEGTMLYIIDSGGKKHNMFEAIKNKGLQKTSISSISASSFCGNNDPKRIMMTAKLSTQSVPTNGESDPFTNRTPARVVFADIDADVYGDSIVISQSFADRLMTHEILHADLKKKNSEYERLSNKVQNKDMDLNRKDLSILMPNLNELILHSYANAKIVRCDQVSDTMKKFYIQVAIPFGIGDKITNLHGSKGVVSHIFPDDKMPFLKNDIGDFKKGPFEVVISGFSVLRRGSLGQLFEAWSKATGIEFEPGEDFIKTAVSKYGKELRDFSSKSIVSYKGEESIKPCGVIDMLRLYHHASTKATISYIKSNSSKMLKLGEMEKLNLAACGCFDILSELSVRSTHKHQNALRTINDMWETGMMPTALTPSLNLARILRSMGINMSVGGTPLTKMDDTESDTQIGKIFRDFIDNSKIDLEDVFNFEDDSNA